MKNRGFTLIELIVIICVIAVLATITVVGLGRIMAQSRDSQRVASTQVLSEALEKYYDENGEYPSCSIMTGSAQTIQQELGIDVAVLKAPNATSTNSITCNDITASTPDDVFAYIGDGSSKCTGTQACLYWTIKYKEEATGEIKTVESRRKANVAVAPSAPTVATTATLSGGNAVGTAATATCPDATIQYSIDLQVNDGSWQGGAWGTSKTRSTTANQGSQYGFRTNTRCVLLDGTEGSVATGNTAEVIRGISAPSAPVVAKSASESHGDADSVVWSWNSTCPSGTTANYSTAYYRDDATGWRDWVDRDTATSQSQPTSAQGYKYSVKIKAACQTAYATSSESAESNVVTYIRDITAPIRPAGFHLERKDYSYGAYTAQYGMVYWDTLPTCASGLSRSFIMQTAYRFDYIGSQISSIMGADVIFTGASDYNSQVSKWKTQWNESLLSGFRYAYDDTNVGNRANPATGYGGGPHSSLINTNTWLDWIPTASTRAWLVNTGGNTVGNAYVKEYRAYVRYACTNQTTGRFAVGEPGMSNYVTF